MRGGWKDCDNLDELPLSGIIEGWNGRGLLRGINTLGKPRKGEMSWKEKSLPGRGASS